MVRIEEQRLWKKLNEEIEDSDGNNGDGEEEERMKRSEKILFQPDLILEVSPLSESVNIVFLFFFLSFF